MQPGQFGTDVNGQVYYDPQRPDQRIGTILTDLGIPRRLWVTLTSSVKLNTGIYSAGETPLSAIQEAADGEFPNVANVFCDRHGRLCFLGRKARFDPAGTAAAARRLLGLPRLESRRRPTVNAIPTDTAQVRALGFQRGLSKIINTATATELGVPDEAIPGRRVTDTASINTYGIRSWSASNLPILLGDTDRAYPTSAATETRRFAQYYVANYAHPRDRITEITFRSLHPDDARAAANWDLLSRIDISDTIEVTVAIPGGGGFSAEQYFVEGVHEDVKPLEPGYDDVTLTLDLSPRAYYAVDPWATPLTAPDHRSPPRTDTNPPKRSRSPRPTVHSRDHEHDGADPIRTHYEKVGTEAGDRRRRRHRHVLDLRGPRRSPTAACATTPSPTAPSRSSTHRRHRPHRQRRHRPRQPQRLEHRHHHDRRRRAHQLGRPPLRRLRGRRLLHRRRHRRRVERARRRSRRRARDVAHDAADLSSTRHRGATLALPMDGSDGTDCGAYICVDMDGATGLRPVRRASRPGPSAASSTTPARSGTPTSTASTTSEPNSSVPGDARLPGDPADFHGTPVDRSHGHLARAITAVVCPLWPATPPPVLTATRGHHRDRL